MGRGVTTANGIGQPLSGDDATNLVAYVDKPNASPGHDAYLKLADKVFATVAPRRLKHS